MPKLRSIEDFRELQSMVAAKVDKNAPCIVICAGTACQASGSNGILRVAKRHLMERQLLEKVRLRITGCHGFCEMGPSILTEPQHAFYVHVKIEDVPRIIDALLAGGYVDELLYADPATGKRYYDAHDVPFFKNQRRALLAMNQAIDPIRIYDYISQGGYGALEKVLMTGNRERVVEEVKDSGLRGRGGGGFPTGLKWELLARQKGDQGKYLVCNADEGDPGAYMDQGILEGNPHSIIEGMSIGAYGTGATEGVVYVRNEYPLAIKHLIIALRQCHEIGLLGEDILGTGFSFDIKLVRGAGAFVCGEETALIRSIEGKMGEPRQRPPYPVEKGIDGKPTAINNVETWANIPHIFRLGAEEFAKIGTDGNSGSKIFSLVGKIKNTGLVEVPMGISIREIVYDIGGGPVGKAKIKAVQTGGPSGGCIPADKFDLRIDYDSLAAAGSIMGSGGMIVMDENTCMVDVAKYFMNFLRDESCGKCFTCRKGTQRMYEILDDISKGQGTAQHVELLEELALAVKDTTMCGLGQTASNPVLSTLRYFLEEYQEHVFEKKCRAFVCKELVGAPCQTGCPLGTEAWRYVAQIARGRYEEAYQVIREANPFPSVCARVCSHPCEDHCRSATGGKRAIAIRSLKRFVTDRVDPSAFQPKRVPGANGNGAEIAIVGSGPAGLSAAHYLSLAGYRPTVFEAEDRPGGMLVSCLPSFRLPRQVLGKEIDALLDGGVSLRCGMVLGRNFSIDSLFEDGFKAVFLATGAHKSRTLGLEGEASEGVMPSIQFLKAFNLRGEELARGRVAVIGGGNSAIDAARVAIRQKAVESVTILYRRTRDEMPAFEEEVEGALVEGIDLQILVSPTAVLTKGNAVTGVRVIKNQLGDRDSDGRRRPVAVAGTETDLPFDTVIVAISEEADAVSFAAGSSQALGTRKNGTLETDPATLMTNRPGVFAGGDLVSGPNTVVDAIADGKKVALMISRWLRGEELVRQGEVRLPDTYVEPVLLSEEELAEADRVESPVVAAAARHRSSQEVELALSLEDATREAQRCLRCDLEFTQPKNETAANPAMAEETT